MKKFFSIAISAALIVGSMAFPSSSNSSTIEASAEGEFNYVEALQKSFFFYEAQQAGPLPEWNRVSWRADSTMSDYVTGGLYDAGDHVKFNLPMAYTATMLAWGLYEYGDALDGTGQREIMENNLEFILDYLVRCDLGDEVVYQIGDGGTDHKWWGAAELVELEMGERPYYTCNASVVTGEMAAALAAGAAALDGRSDRVDEYLEHSKSLFELADTVRSDESYTEADGFYTSWSGFWDELFWASNWLYIATDDSSYLDKATSYIPNLGRENQSTELKYTWGHCWDDKMQGAMVLYARSTGDPVYIEQVQKHLDYWTVGYGGKQVQYTPGGLAWLDSWGCLRYATTTGFLAAVWCDYIDDEVLIERYTEFYESQINYALGDNPEGRSYVVGFGEDSPEHPHHRTSHGSWSDKDINPENHRHVLYGALVGGPNSDDTYEDDVQNYTNNEVATDYNAGYTALLCKMVEKYGGTALEDFPVEEEPDGPEFYIEAGINQASNTFTELKVLATNHSAWPARYIEDLSYNYYFDLTEVFEAGYTEKDVTVKIGYDEWSTTQISEPIQYDGNIYYVKITYPDGSVLAPIGQEQNQAELQFRISVPDGTSFWDPTNDYSYDGLESGNVMSITSKITMYDGDTLIYGTEPDGTTPDDVTPVETETETDAETATDESSATQSESETDTDTETETETESVSASSDNTDIVSTSDSGDYTDSDTATETETETASESTESSAVTETETDAESESEIDTETESQPDDIDWPEVMYGDVDLNGKVELFDVIELNKSLVAAVQLTPTALENANCADYEKNEVDVFDSVAILQYLLGMLPYEALGPSV